VTKRSRAHKHPFPNTDSLIALFNIKGSICGGSILPTFAGGRPIAAVLHREEIRPLHHRCRPFMYPRNCWHSTATAATRKKKRYENANDEVLGQRSVALVADGAMLLLLQSLRGPGTAHHPMATTCAKHCESRSTMCLQCACM
jgi:hypothetical protein